MKYIYLGSFPPPYGGVTIKNKYLFTLLSKHFNIIKVDFSAIKRRNIIELLKMIFYILENNIKIIGVTGRKTKKRFTRIMYMFSRKSMRQSIIMVMGGTAAKDIVEDASYRKYMSCYKTIYVETETMLNTALAAGLKNVSLYPNGRFRPDNFPSIKEHKQLKCVFFSLINEMKGVDIILDVAKNNPDILFDFWGHIEENYKKCFLDSSASSDNLDYKGVYTGSADEVYELLSNYDILLLPTRYTTEGVPGVLVEAKIAGIPSIVSGVSYNADIIKDGIDGFILKNNNQDELSKAIKRLDKDRTLLKKMKNNSRDSAEYYYIDNYEKELLKDLYH